MGVGRVGFGSSGEGQTKRGDECKRREINVRDIEKVKSKKNKKGGFRGKTINLRGNINEKEIKK
jgi:hypothetical protein